jgi:hypothetical protein
MVLPFHHPNFSPLSQSAARPEFGTAFQHFQRAIVDRIQAYYLDVLGRSTANLIGTPTCCLVVPFLATIPDI